VWVIYTGSGASFPFYWESGSGEERILCWSAGRGYSFFHSWLADKLSASGTEPIWQYLTELEKKGYPYEMAYFRYTVYGDNGPPDGEMSDIIRKWNEKYASPQFVIGTTHQLFTAFEEKYGEQIPDPERRYDSLLGGWSSLVGQRTGHEPT